MNLLFQTAKPRRFSHTMVFCDERRERLRMIEAHAKRELGMLSEGQPADRRLPEWSFSARRGGRRKSGLPVSGLSGAALLFLLLLLCLLPWL